MPAIRLLAGGGRPVLARVASGDRAHLPDGLRGGIRANDTMTLAGERRGEMRMAPAPPDDPPQEVRAELLVAAGRPIRTVRPAPQGAAGDPPQAECQRGLRDDDDVGATGALGPAVGPEVA